MTLKKICMLGPTSVGKTSLVARYVQSLFADKYLTTVGVKIDKKIIQVGTEQVTLMLWDLAGDDDFQKLEMSYLRGAAGYLLVADGTRPASVERAEEIQRRVQTALGSVPFILAMNKADLVEQWAVPDQRIESWCKTGWSVRRTSAKTGAGVEACFMELAEKLIAS